MPRTTNERWDLPETEIKLLRTRYKATRERRLADRIMCVLLKAEKRWPHQEIAAFLDIHVDTVTAWLQAYLDGGLERL
jgi:DNA-directed RNA polymerase specialized sigma24 family protein